MSDVNGESGCLVAGCKGRCNGVDSCIPSQIFQSLNCFIMVLGFMICHGVGHVLSR